MKTTMTTTCHHQALPLHPQYLPLIPSKQEDQAGYTHQDKHWWIRHRGIEHLIKGMVHSNWLGFRTWRMFRQQEFNVRPLLTRGIDSEEVWDLIQTLVLPASWIVNFPNQNREVSLLQDGTSLHLMPYQFAGTRQYDGKVYLLHRSLIWSILSRLEREGMIWYPIDLLIESIFEFGWAKVDFGVS